MTASLSTLAMLRAGRARELHDLGACPPHYRPWARMRWARKRKAIGLYWYEAARDVVRDEGWLTPGMELRMREGWL